MRTGCSGPNPIGLRGDNLHCAYRVRVPVGKPILELLAGMLDDNMDDVVGTTIREVKKETGIKLNLDDTVDLTSILDPSTECNVIPSRVCVYMSNPTKGGIVRYD